MGGLHGSQEPVAAHPRGGVGAWLIAGLLMVSFALPASAVAAGITSSAPAGTQTYPDQSEGPVGYTQAPSPFARPTPVRRSPSRPTAARSCSVISMTCL